VQFAENTAAIRKKAITIEISTILTKNITGFRKICLYKCVYLTI
jgi:hypothetical protein